MKYPIGSFKMQDSWKNDLKHSYLVKLKKYYGRINAIIVLYDKEGSIMSLSWDDISEVELKLRLLKRENIDSISKAITHFIFRNGPVEDVHANNQLCITNRSNTAKLGYRYRQRYIKIKV